MTNKANRYSVSAKKLRRILRWLRNRQIRVCITFNWINSIQMSQHRRHIGVIKDFTVTTKDFGDIKDFNIHIKFDNGTEMEETLGDYWEFNPRNPDKMKRCELMHCNSGPYCGFIIKRLDLPDSDGT